MRAAKRYATEAIFTIDDRQLTAVSNTNRYDTENVQIENVLCVYERSSLAEQWRAVPYSAVCASVCECVCVNAGTRRRVLMRERESQLCRSTQSLVGEFLDGRLRARLCRRPKELMESGRMACDDGLPLAR